LNDLAKSFGKDSGYTVGLVLLPAIFVPMLSYGSARYLGPGAGQQFMVYPQGYAQYPGQYQQGYGQAPAQYPQGYAQAPGQMQPPTQQYSIDQQHSGDQQYR